MTRFVIVVCVALLVKGSDAGGTEIRFDAEAGQTPESVGFVRVNTQTVGRFAPAGQGIKIPALGNSVWEVDVLGAQGGYVLALPPAVNDDDGFEFTAYARTIAVVPQNDCGNTQELVWYSADNCATAQVSGGESCLPFQVWYFYRMVRQPGSNTYTRWRSTVDSATGEIIPNSTIVNTNEPLRTGCWPDGSGVRLSFVLANNGSTLLRSQFDNICYRVLPSPGPRVLLAAPSAPMNMVYSAGPVTSLRFAFDDPIVIGNPADDVRITNQGNFLVQFTLQGSGTRLVEITLLNPLLNDQFRVELRDTIVSAVTGRRLDGDGDGEAGGQFIYSLGHRDRCCDVNLDGTISVSDIAPFVNCLVGFGG